MPHNMLTTTLGTDYGEFESIAWECGGVGLRCTAGVSS